MLGYKELELKLLVYKTINCKEPFYDWLLKLKNREARAIIRARLNRVKLGNYGDAKSLGAGVFELRIHFGSGYRVYFGKQCKEIVILLCGGDKSSQKKDITLAKMFWHCVY